MPTSDALPRFAEAHQLAYSDRAELPAQGDLLQRAEPPGLSAKDLDVYLSQLSGELKEAEQTASLSSS